MTYSNANFTPGLKGYSNVKPFRFWCQKVLPLVYDDSLSYYELLCKVVDYLNNVISDLSATEDNVGELLDAYNQLQAYVNNYFTNLDVQEEINNKLDAMFEDGTIPTMIEEYVHPFIVELNENYAELDNQINETMETQNANIATLTARVNNLVINNTTNLTGYDVVTVESTTAQGGSTVTENIPLNAEILQVYYSGYNDTNDTLKSANISYVSTPNVPSSTQQQVVVTITDSTDTRFNVFITYAVSQNITIAELTDIRTGYDGTVYSSAGNAVRGQISDVNNGLSKKIDRIGENYICKVADDNYNWELGSINSSGVNVVSESRIRMAQNNYLPVNKGDLVVYEGNHNCLSGVFYDSTHTLDSTKGFSFTNGNQQYVQADGYLRIILRKNENNDAISNDEIATMVSLLKVYKAVPSNLISSTDLLAVKNDLNNEIEAISHGSNIEGSDYTWELGALNINTGYESSANNRLRCTSNSKIPVHVGDLIINLGEPNCMQGAFYSNASTLDPTYAFSFSQVGNTYKVLADGYYRLILRKSDNSDISNADQTTLINNIKVYRDISTVVSDTVSKSIENRYEVTSDISMFTRIGCIGDSFTQGVLYFSSSDKSAYDEISYPRVMERLYGSSFANFGLSGATTASYIEDKLPSLLQAEKQQLYLLCLGINDNSQNIPIGTVADIKADYTQNPATYYGNYGRIIDQIKTYAPNAKFIILKSFWVRDANGALSSYYTYNSSAVEGIASKYGFPYIDTLNSEFFNSPEYYGQQMGYHPTALLYAGMAREIGRLVGKCIINNNSYFGTYRP